MTYSIKDVNGTNIIADLGIVASEGGGKQASLSAFEFFGEDSDQTEVDDFGGAVRTLTLRTAKAGSLSDLKTFIDSVEGLINGEQTPENNYPYQLVSDLTGTTKVKFLDVNWELNNSRPRIIDVTIRMYQAAEGI